MVRIREELPRRLDETSQALAKGVSQTFDSEADVDLEGWLARLSKKLNKNP